MASLPSSETLFAETVKSYRDSISEKERDVFDQFPDKAAMLQELKTLTLKHTNASRLTKYLAKIASFSNAFEPYFEIINIFMQVKPEYTSLIWGPIRLIFQFGTNHIVFLEKISDLFEEVSVLLPQYRQHYQICQQRTFTPGDQSRIVSLLTLVYQDVITFCGEIYLIFCRRSKESHLIHNLRIVRDTVWKPFNSRFAKLKDRLAKHRELFDQEMRLNDREWLNEQFNEFNSYIQDKGKAKERDLAIEREREKKAADDKLTDLQLWIWNREHKSVYEKAAQNRHSGSCQWILGKPEYVEWRDQSFITANVENPAPDRESWQERLLSLQAKPGFGKTMISSMIIDDLAAQSMLSAGPNNLVPTLAYFHFDHLSRTGGRFAAEALRAIAAQLIDASRQDQSFMDALFILFNQRSRSQLSASVNDIHAILQIAMQRSPTFIVIDGIDECADEQELLTSLWRILNATDCRVVLLHRPNVQFPTCYRETIDKQWQIHLGIEDNFQDIQTFLEGQFQNMTAVRLFGDETIEQDVIDDLAQRSAGMFLWAVLLVHYLESPALSPLDRFEMIQEANLLEGVGNLYRRILSLLETRYEKVKKVAADTFKWLAFSLYQLSSTELRIALAIVPGTPTSKLQLLSDFPACLQQVTCALVDVNSKGHINFIHSSFWEYLTMDSTCPTRFSLKDRSAIHGYLAARCMSYILYDVPERPLRNLEDPDSLGNRLAAQRGEINLQSRESRPQRKEIIMKRHQFIRYASFGWAWHLENCLPSLVAEIYAGSRPDKNGQDEDNLQIRNQYDRVFFCGSGQALWSNGDNVNMFTRQSNPQISQQQRHHRSIGHNMTSRKSNSGSVDLNDMRSNSIQQRDDPGADFSTWVPLLAEFMVRRVSITLWVEACWTFNWPPNVNALSVQLQVIASWYSPRTTEGREMLFIANSIHELASALYQLRIDHSEMMFSNPTSIWQNQIVDATDHYFWPVMPMDVKISMENDEVVLPVRAGHLPKYDLSAASSGGGGGGSSALPFIT